MLRDPTESANSCAWLTLKTVTAWTRDKDTVP